MSVETWQMLTLIFFVLSGTLFVVSACLFFYFNIPEIIGNLSGLTAKKAIENIKAKNEGERKENVSYSRIVKGKRTGLNKDWGKTTLLESYDVSETVRLDIDKAGETTIFSVTPDVTATEQLTGELPGFNVDIDIVMCENIETIE